MHTGISTAVGVLVAGALLSGAPGAQPLTASDARTIAKEAVIYGFPLVDNYRVQHAYFVDRANPEYKGAWNVFHHTSRVYTPQDKAVQTPNSDTPYSFLGADLRSEPLVISVPAVEKGRYYSLQFIDQYTFNFAYVGSRATGNGAGNFLLAGPGWKGTPPAGVKAVLRSETAFAFVIVRTQLFNAADIESVKKIQAGYRVQPLSAFLGRPAPAAQAPANFINPLAPQAQRTSPEFFAILDFVLRFCPAPASERALRDRFARLGLGTGKPFDFDAFPTAVQQAIRDGMADAWKAFEAYKVAELDTGKKTSADAFGNRAFLNGDWMSRMAGAILGIYGNSKDEALYPAYFVDAGKEKLEGSRRYRLRFAPGQLPPVNAFWSLTLYELPSSLLYANALDRYLINSPQLPSLKRDQDGAITLYIQHESPGKDLESNWLPSPAGPFFMAMRLYWPKPEALSGKWKAPAAERAN